MELQDGQTFAIAGLLNNSAPSSMRKIPGIGDIPVLGSLFKSQAYQKDQTELVVMVTPTIVRQDGGDVVGLPSVWWSPSWPRHAEPDGAARAAMSGAPVYPVNPGGNDAPRRPTPWHPVWCRRWAVQVSVRRSPSARRR